MNYSPSIEDYLKQLYIIGANKRVNTLEIATSLNISPASVSSMMRKLNELGLVDYAPYKGAILTEKGKKAALKVIRHHRLIELFLHKSLGLPLDELHEEAEILEHALSEKLGLHIANWLGNPDYDAHGDPIPTASGKIPIKNEISLDQAKEGDAIISSISDKDSKLLKYFTDINIFPKTKIKILEKNQILGTIEIENQNKSIVLSMKAAKEIKILKQNS